MNRKTLIIIGVSISLSIFALLIYLLFFYRGGQLARNISVNQNIDFELETVNISGDETRDRNFAYQIDEDLKLPEWEETIKYQNMLPNANVFLISTIYDIRNLSTKNFLDVYTWEDEESSVTVTYRGGDYLMTVSSQDGFKQLNTESERKKYINESVRKFVPDEFEYKITNYLSESGESAYYVDYLLNGKVIYIDGSRQMKGSFIFDNSTNQLINLSMYSFLFDETGEVFSLEEKDLQKLLDNADVPKYVFSISPEENSEEAYVYQDSGDGVLQKAVKLTPEDMTITKSALVYNFYTKSQVLIESLRLEAEGDANNTDYITIPLVSIETIAE